MKWRDLKSSPGSLAWLRMAGLMLVIGAADCIAVCFAKKPVIYAAIIPGLLPLLTVPVVIVSLLKATKK